MAIEWSDIVAKDEAELYHDFPEEFTPNGINDIGVQIQIATDNEHARYRDGNNASPSLWRQIHSSHPDNPDLDLGIFHDDGMYLELSNFIRI